MKVRNGIGWSALLVTGVWVSAAGWVPGADTSLVRMTEPRTPEEEQKALRVPEGFEIRLFASEPMINKPINLAYDSRGRIWVSSTVEYPYAAAKERWSDAKGTRVEGSRDAIKILEDTDGDGAADKVTDFADGLNIPTGVVPWHKPEHKDGCIAWSIPNIWYFADTDGDGKCDLREVLFGPLGYEKDTHGMCSSFRLREGWVYATHGFNNTSRLRATDGSALEMHSGNVFRFRPDGSRVEIWSRGQVNPFGLCFDRRGNLYSADCHSAPVYQLMRGAHYPSFGKPHDGLGFAPTMIEHTHGSTGICGIAYVDRGVWGEGWEDRVLIGNPVTSRVNRDRVEYVGSTPVAVEEPDFVVSDDPWFRPVDLCLGGDGALYVADFYNRIIGHYEVPLDHPGRDRERGRIWKIVRVGGAGKAEAVPDGERGPWTPAALGDGSAMVRRMAAAQFQAAPEEGALGALVAALGEVEDGDTHLRYALRLAIREHLGLPGAFGEVGSGQVAAIADICLAVHTPEAARFLVRAFVSGTEMGEEMVLKMLGHIGRNAGLEELVSVVTRERAREGGDVLGSAARLDALVGGMEERGMVPPPSEVLGWGQELAEELLAAEEPRDARWVELPHPGGAKSASPWVVQKRKCEDGTEAEVLSSLRIGEARVEERTGILRSVEFTMPEELGFWICGHRGMPDKAAHENTFARLVDAKTGEELVRAYPPRSDVCQPARWAMPEQVGRRVRVEIVDGDAGSSYAWLGVTRFSIAGLKVEDFGVEGSRAKMLGRLASLLKVTAPADLRDRLRPYLPAVPAPAPAAISAEERAKVDAMIVARAEDFEKKGGDAGGGQKVFEAQCAVCHQVGGKGGLVGPQLDGIGVRGAARLCEDILDPNRNVDAHFYLTTVTMKDGAVAGGLVRGESGEVVVLTDVAGADHRILKPEIKSRETVPVSLMPPGFGERVTEGEFRDLLAWLLAQKK